MSDLEPNTPILVGIAAIQQKLDDWEQALEPVALMAQAVEAAARDAGSFELLERADEIQVPKGMWHYLDPARWVAEAVGAGNARTVLAEIGVLQQSMMTRACRKISDGDANIVIVTGGEAKYRGLCAAKAGAEASETQQEGVEPDETLVPDDDIWDIVESVSGLGMPVGFYAIIDSALRYKQGLSVTEHRDQMAAMYQRFSEVAASNPDAWSDEAMPAEFIREGSQRNRMLAFPYTKYHNTQWNVDQASGLIFCNVKTAQELGIPRSKWLFPRASTESNFMTVVSARKDLGGSPGFRHAGQQAMAMAGVSFDDIRLREIYSCFPSAVRVQLEEFGMKAEGDITVMGGMTFGGGPLNNFVLQSTVRMGELLREQPGEVGLVTTVSGMLTKQACALWSTEHGERGWDFADVTEAVRADCELCEVIGEVVGSGVVAGYTVLYQGHEPWRAVAVFDLPDGRRTVAYSEEPALIELMLGDEECCGRSFQLDKGIFSAA